MPCHHTGYNRNDIQFYEIEKRKKKKEERKNTEDKYRNNKKKLSYHLAQGMWQTLEKNEREKIGKEEKHHYWTYAYLICTNFSDRTIILL